MNQLSFQMHKKADNTTSPFFKAKEKKNIKSENKLERKRIRSSETRKQRHQ